jgi:hypothetical protein
MLHLLPLQVTQQVSFILYLVLSVAGLIQLCAVTLPITQNLKCQGYIF